MKILQVGEFKSRFSEVIENIRKGEEVTISFGKKKEKIAVLIPYSKYMKKANRKIGLLENK
ncbi:MAG: type II toxin-antitoxin system prevent-host-death family antitoxin, partial [Spirochaetota bacterium]